MAKVSESHDASHEASAITAGDDSFLERSMGDSMSIASGITGITTHSLSRSNDSISAREPPEYDSSTELLIEIEGFSLADVSQGECRPPRPNTSATAALVAAASEDEANGAVAAGTVALQAPPRQPNSPFECLAYNLRVAQRPRPHAPAGGRHAQRYGVKRYAGVVMLGEAGTPRFFVKQRGVQETLAHWEKGVAGVAARDAMHLQCPGDAPGDDRLQWEKEWHSWASGFREAWQHMYANTVAAPGDGAANGGRAAGDVEGSNELGVGADAAMSRSTHGVDASAEDASAGGARRSEYARDFPEHVAWPPPPMFWKRCAAHLRWNRRLAAGRALAESLESGEAAAGALEAARTAASQVRPAAFRVETLDCVQLQMLGINAKGTLELLGGEKDAAAAPRRVIKALMTGRMPEQMGQWAAGSMVLSKLYVTWEVTFDPKEVLLQDCVRQQSAPDRSSDELSRLSPEELEVLSEAKWEAERRLALGCDWHTLHEPEPTEAAAGLGSEGGIASAGAGSERENALDASGMATPPRAEADKQQSTPTGAGEDGFDRGEVELAAKEVLTPASPDRELMLGVPGADERAGGGRQGWQDPSRMPWEGTGGDDGGQRSAGDGEMQPYPAYRGDAVDGARGGAPRSTPSPVGPWLPDWQGSGVAGGDGSVMDAQAGLGRADSDWTGLSPRETKLVRYVSRLLRQRDASSEQLTASSERESSLQRELQEALERGQKDRDRRGALQAELDQVRQELATLREERVADRKGLGQAGDGSPISDESDAGKADAGGASETGGALGNDDHEAPGGLMVWQWILLVLLAFATGIATNGEVNRALLEYFQ